ncbi:MAG TPA: thioredoxin [Phycisphaerales bacterium]|nr:thioredoxin [Phycisphaerales bacterium]
MLKNKENKSQAVAIETPPAVISESNQPAQPQKLPKLIELGADKCIPCKMMKPILDELTAEYKGKLDVMFHDVWKEPAYAEKYNIEIIPTQIFLGPDDKELFRHQGFFAKEEILTKWKELGFELK